MTPQDLIDQWRLHPDPEVGSCANQLAGWLRTQNTPESFNVNWYVRVRLTDTGRAHLRKVWPIYRSKVEESDGLSRWQLWSLMETFGAAMYLGCDPPFETTIELEGDRAAEVAASRRGGDTRPPLEEEKADGIR
jgi:hypothetical protein